MDSLRETTAEEKQPAQPTGGPMIFENLVRDATDPRREWQPFRDTVQRRLSSGPTITKGWPPA